MRVRNAASESVALFTGFTTYTNKAVQPRTKTVPRQPQQKLLLSSLVAVILTRFVFVGIPAVFETHSFKLKVRAT